MSNWYKDITIFESIKRVRDLTSIGNDIHQYFEACINGDQQQAAILRQSISRTMERCHRYILYAGIHTTVYYAPAPITGGLRGDVDLLRNVFLLDSLSISPQFLFDQLNQVIGVYQDDNAAAWVRTFNPLWWFVVFMKLFIHIPITLLKWLGFNGSKIEKSYWGKIVKTLWAIIGIPITIDALLSLLGYQGVVANILQTWKYFFLGR